MDETQIQELQTTSNWFNSYNQLLKKSLQLFVSLSLFSLLLSCSSTSTSHFFHYLNFHFSAVLFSLFSQALERKYIFLICNGIVVVLAKNLSFITSSSSLTSDFIEDVVKTAVSETEAPVQEVKEVVAETAIESPDYVSVIVKEEGWLYDMPIQNRESSALITETEAEDEEKLEETEPLIPISSEENEVNMSTEDLNRKIEEFIRKMKEEIRTEAQQQQLIHV